MLRRVLIALLSGLILVAGGVLMSRPRSGGPAAVADEVKGEKSGFVIYPYLQYATPTSITVMWETSFPGTSSVRYGVGTLTKTAEGAKDVTLHEVALTDLRPGTAHVYEVTTVGKDGK